MKFHVLIVLSLAATFGACVRTERESEMSAEILERHVLEKLSGGHQSDAEHLLADWLKSHPLNPRIEFIQAVCMRSRWFIHETLPKFASVAQVDPASVSGQCASCIMRLDRGEAVDEALQKLVALAEAHPKDPLIRWALAIECWSLRKLEEGRKHYQVLLTMWNPGPVLLHQSYANLLDAMKRYEEALVERHKAVDLEPTGWSYQGLGNTLIYLKRYKEAIEALSKAIEIDPDYAPAWSSLGWSLTFEGRYDEAIDKLKVATRLDSGCIAAWCNWGFALKRLGLPHEAAEKYRRALQCDPNCVAAKVNLEAIERASANHGAPPDPPVQHAQ